nr:Bm8176 [Brugia malayi]
MDERQRAIKVALMMMFEQHPPLMRALLDTGDALLVYCSRYSSLEAELTVGMRERDLRAWLAQIDIDTRQLFDSTVRPLAFRPPYLGGNRLGLILMEIRREFMLRGVFPQQLPELQIGVEAVLGSESPAENYVSIYPFDVLNSDNFSALWTNPFLLLAKQNKDGELWTQANSVKLAPKLISINETTLSAIVDELDIMEKVTEEDLENYCIEDLRAVFVRLALRMRNRLVETEAQQSEMNLLAREITAMQNMRRALEERKAQLEGGPTQERREKRELLAPLARTELPMPLMRGYSPPRKWDEKRKPIQRRYSPPEEKIPRRRSPTRLKSPTSHISRKSSPSSKSPLKQQKATKPPVDESELSDGEILSD